MVDQVLLSSGARRQSAIVAAKSLALLTLLIAELLLITIRFDTYSLSSGDSWFSVFAENTSTIPQLLTVIVAATLIFGWREIQSSASAYSACVIQHRSWPLWLAVHLLTLGAWYALTGYFFEVDRGSSTLWFSLWLLVGLLLLLSWLAALIHPTDWIGIGRNLLGSVAVGAAIGILGWLAGLLTAGAWDTLAYGTFEGVVLLLNAMGVEVVQDVEQLTLGTQLFYVHIDSSCSGYQGIGLALVFFSSYLWWRREDHRFPQALLLLPLAVLAMFLSNVLRIFALILIGHFGWQEIALGGFHSQAGWLAFNVVCLGLVAMARVSPFFTIRTEATLRSRPLDSVPMLMPFVVLTLTIMLTAAFQQGFDWLYPVRVLTVSLAVLFLAKQLRPGIWRWSFDWAAPVCGIAVYLMWIGLEPASASDLNQTSFEAARAQSPGWIAAWLFFRIFGSVVTVPIAEEFAFRGYLLPWLTVSKGSNDSSPEWSWTAILISSALFGVLHPGRWFAGTLAGIAYGLAYYRRGKLMDSVIAHGITNALIAIQVCMLGDWNLWS